MNTPTVLAGALVAALVPAAAQAAKPKPKPNPGGAGISLAASPNPLVYSKNVALTGKLAGGTAAVTVKLEADDTRPYGDSYKATGATTTTAGGGAYAFSVKPQKNTQYRVVAQASPPVTSAAKLVLVRPLVGLRVSSTTPLAGRTVRFSGIVQPARTGATVSVQRRTPTGAFLTVKRAVLAATPTGSAYSVRVRVTRSGAYRVKLPGTAQLVNGFSRTVKLTTR